MSADESILSGIPSRIPPGTKWFPPPAKMAPPKPDLGTPPVAITSVNIRKRSRGEDVADSSQEGGKRPSKRSRRGSNDREAPGYSGEYSEESEEAEEDSSTSSGEEVPGTPLTDGASQERSTREPITSSTTSQATAPTATAPPFRSTTPISPPLTP